MARERVALPGKRVGTIEVLAGDVIPDGYMVCDGALLNKIDYPKLFEVIGTAWGSPNINTFNLPDLRGRFLRGVDKDAAGNPTPIARDPDRDTRTGNAGGNIGNNVGSVQDDQMQKITGSFSFKPGANTNPVGAFTGATNGGSSGDNFQSLIDRVNFDSANSPNAKVSATTNGETRSKNANVIYIIKVI
jgi:hypothetical protein